MNTELLKQARDALAKSEPTGIYKYSMTAAKRHENLIKEIDAALAQPADEDAWLFRSLVWRFEEDRDMGPGGYWRASVHTADPKIRNDLRKVLIAAATKGDGECALHNDL